MNSGMIGIIGLLSSALMSLTVLAAPITNFAASQLDPYCGEPLYQSLAFDVVDLQTAYENGDVTKRERDDLIRDWTATWDQEIQRCLLELHRRSIRLGDQEGNQNIAKGDGLKFPPVSAPLAALDTKGTIGPIETTDGLEHAADLGVRMELPETMDGDQYIRDAMTTRERMKNRWASLIETVVHGVERVD